MLFASFLDCSLFQYSRYKNRLARISLFRVLPRINSEFRSRSNIRQPAGLGRREAETNKFLRERYVYVCVCAGQFIGINYGRTCDRRTDVGAPSSTAAPIVIPPVRMMPLSRILSPPGLLARYSRNPRPPLFIFNCRRRARTLSIDSPNPFENTRDRYRAHLHIFLLTYFTLFFPRSRRAESPWPPLDSFRL